MAEKKRRRRPRLGRAGRTALNFALVLLAGFLLWAHGGYPLPTAALRFQRMARSQLLSPMEFRSVIRVQEDGKEEVMSVGWNEDAVLVHRDNWNRIAGVWERRPGGTLVSLPYVETVPPDTDAPVHILAPDPPEGTASATLTARVRTELKLKPPDWGGTGGEAVIFDQEDVHDPEVLGNYVQMDERYQAEGQPCGGGMFLFYLERKHLTEEWSELGTSEAWAFDMMRGGLPFDSRADWLQVELECVFWDENGAELGRAAVSGTPES